jgi:autotransporter-associated beta strand protein
MKTKLLIILGLITPVSAYAGSATWNLNPGNNDWNTATNWMPATVPNSPTDVATFDLSNTTNVAVSAVTTVDSVVFGPGASAFTITGAVGTSVTISGAGVVNNSGITQNFVASAGRRFASPVIYFTNSASAGMQTTYTNRAAHQDNATAGLTQFSGTASAGSATFINEGATINDKGGITEFLDNSTASQGTFINNQGELSFEPGGFTIFRGNSLAGTGSFINNENGTIEFHDNTSADHGVFTNSGLIKFYNNSTAANGTFTGAVVFNDTANAGNASFTDGVTVYGGSLSNATVTATGSPFGIFPSAVIALLFEGSTADDSTLTANEGAEIIVEFGATAGAATMTGNPSPVADGKGSEILFLSGKTSAGDSHITVNGAAVLGEEAAAILTFGGGQATTAANATIVVTGGSNGGNGGLIQFLANAKGGTCRIELLGNSQLVMAPDRDLDLTIGSLEGEGTATLGGHALIIGSNNLSTAFSGLIQDGTGVGAVAKIGTGTLTLTGANTYTGGTTVTTGVLLVSNASGSGTGTGAVTVNGGTLGGSGIISGTVSVGTNTNTASFLAPSKGAKRPATLAIQGALTLNDDSTYLYKLNTKHRVSDQVLAQGVTIDNGAKFSFRASGTTQLPQGQVFTVISNTAASGISGRFHNLADGAIVTENGNNLQASYSGGDGNDLTLTVVP